MAETMFALLVGNALIKLLFPFSTKIKGIYCLHHFECILGPMGPVNKMFPHCLEKAKKIEKYK